MTLTWRAPLVSLFAFAVALALAATMLAPTHPSDDAADPQALEPAASPSDDDGPLEVYNVTHGFVGTPTGMRHDTLVVRAGTQLLRVEADLDAEPGSASSLRLRAPDGAEVLFCRTRCEGAYDAPSPGMWRLDYEGSDEATARVVVRMEVPSEAPPEFVYDVTRTFPPDLMPSADGVRAIDGFLVHEGHTTLLLNIREDASTTPTMVRLRGPDGELRVACGIACTVSPATPGLWRIEYANMPLGGTVRVAIEAVA